MKELKLRVLTPTARHPSVACDSIRLTLRDDTVGHGGGSYGVHPGHTQALLVLAPGRLSAFLDGKPVLSGVCGSGFATVENDAVTAVVESFTPDP